MPSLGRKVTIYAIAITSGNVLAGAAYPLLSTLTRYQANYTPIGRLGRDEVERPVLLQQLRPDPVENTFWAMCKRVKRLEGWAGLYKGFS